MTVCTNTLATAATLALGVFVGVQFTNIHAAFAGGEDERADKETTGLPENDIAKLNDRFGALTELVGYAYEIDATWEDGTPIRARSEYRADLDGNALITRTWTNGPDGEMYQRYLMLWTCNPETGAIETFGADYTGLGSRQDLELLEAGDGSDPVLFSLRTMDTPAGEVTIKQHVTIEEGGKGYGWKVWSRAEGAEEWTQMMDGRWARAGKLDD